MTPNDEYADFILDKLARLEVVSSRRMFGGRVIHMAGKVLGFIFEETFFFEPGPTAERMLPDAPRRELFPGSKLFFIIDESISAARLCELAEACYDDFPLSKPRKRSRQDALRKKEVEERFPFSKNLENK
ncbi:MAG: hypothetical protein MJY44_04830 [Bacteroidales bacterium]|nr:hypothetical protein [Bacteroidales bacterium]